MSPFPIPIPIPSAEVRVLTCQVVLLLQTSQLSNVIIATLFLSSLMFQIVHVVGR